MTTSEVFGVLTLIAMLLVLILVFRAESNIGDVRLDQRIEALEKLHQTTDPYSGQKSGK